MSRAEHHTTTSRRVLAGLVPSVLGLGLAALLTGCGAGQITQTDTQEAGINGANATVGAMAIRDAQLAAPSNAQGVYPPGSTARLIVTIVNTGITDDTLLKVTSPAMQSVTIDGSATGSKLIPGGFSVSSGTDPDDTTSGAGSAVVTSAPVASVSAPPTSTSGAGVPSGSVAPSASGTPLPPGKITIDLVGIKSINGGSLRAGLTIPITFYFAHAGQVTLGQVPIGVPADNAALLSTANG